MKKSDLLQLINENHSNIESLADRIDAIEERMVLLVRLSEIQNDRIKLLVKKVYQPKVANPSIPFVADASEQVSASSDSDPA